MPELPLWRRARDAIVARIADGEFPAGVMLPSEPQLGKQLGVSQGTARKALAELERAGLVERRQGKGTFVPVTTPERALFHFFRLRRSDGAPVTPELVRETLRRRRPAARERAVLGEGPVIEIARVRALDGRPAARERIVLPAARFARLADRSPLPNTLYVLYQRAYGIAVVRAEEALWPVAAEAADAVSLGVAEGAPSPRSRAPGLRHRGSRGGTADEPLRDGGTALRRDPAMSRGMVRAALTVAPAALLARTRTLFPGVVAAVLVALAAQWVAEHHGAPAMLMALLFGMALGFLGQEGRAAPGVGFAARTVLRLGVALLGARISVEIVAGLGWRTVALVLGAIAATIGFGLGAARFFGQGPRFAILTAGSVAICGASAAMAIAAVLPRDARSERNLLFTVLGVTVLSTAAMIVYPVALGLAGWDDRLAGAFLGATIHDVAQVVGAGFSISEGGRRDRHPRQAHPCHGARPGRRSGGAVMAGRGAGGPAPAAGAGLRRGLPRARGAELRGADPRGRAGGRRHGLALGTRHGHRGGRHEDLAARRASRRPRRDRPRGGRDAVSRGPGGRGAGRDGARRVRDAWR